MPVAITTTNKLYSNKIKNRRAARIIAIQCLYSKLIDVSENLTIDEKIAGIIEIYLNIIPDSKLAKVNQPMLINLTRFAVENSIELEQVISKHLTSNWKFERLPKVVACILKCAAAELFFDKTLDKEIIINDYLEIAKLFNHEGEVGFINSILDKISETR